MVNFIASKVGVGILSALGGVGITLGVQKVVKVVREPKPLVFDAKAMAKLPADAQRAVRDYARDAEVLEKPKAV